MGANISMYTVLCFPDDPDKNIRVSINKGILWYGTGLDSKPPPLVIATDFIQLIVYIFYPHSQGIEISAYPLYYRLSLISYRSLALFFGILTNIHLHHKMYY